MATSQSSSPTGLRTCPNVCWWICGVIFVLLIVLSLVFIIVSTTRSSSRPIRGGEKSSVFPTTLNDFHSKETRAGKQTVVVSPKSTTTGVASPKSTTTQVTSTIPYLPITKGTSPELTTSENTSIIPDLIGTKVAFPELKSATTTVIISLINKTTRSTMSSMPSSTTTTNAVVSSSESHFTLPVSVVTTAEQFENKLSTSRSTRAPDIDQTNAINKKTTAINKEASIIQSKLHHKTTKYLSTISTKQDATNRIQSEKWYEYSNEELKVNEERRNFIKINMTLKAWNAYKTFGWGCGELVNRGNYMYNDYDEDCVAISPSPTELDKKFWQGSAVKWIVGAHHQLSSNYWSKGATIVTGLDTLLIMDLKKQFREGKEWIQNHLYINTTLKPIINIKRTIPTYVGGLLSCYFLTNDTVFATKANQLVSYFYSEYNKPQGSIQNINAPSTPYLPTTPYDQTSVFSELNIEFHYLSDVTRNETYRKSISERVGTINKFASLRPHGLFRNAASLDFYDKADALWPELTSESGGNYLDYLLKAWLKGGRKNVELRNNLTTIADSVTEYIIKRKGNFTYVSIFKLPNTTDEGYMAHSLCYLGGWFALAGAALGGAYKERYLKIGENITTTCHKAHLVEPPLPVGYFRVTAGGLIVNYTTDPGYQLTAQSVESYFILWRITHDQKYRDWGWELAKGIVQYNKDMQGIKHDEVMPSLFFGRVENYHEEIWAPRQHMPLISETLKYLYLLYCDDNYFSLDEWIFNANGHPLPIDSHKERMRQLGPPAF